MKTVSKFRRMIEEDLNRKPFSYHNEFHYPVFSWDRSQTTYLFEHVEDFYENIDIYWFMETYLKSIFRSYCDFAWEKAFDRQARELFHEFVYVDFNGDYSLLKKSNKGQHYGIFEREWIAEIYIRLGMFYSTPIKNIVEVFPLKLARHAFVVGHTQSFEWNVGRFDETFKENILNKVTIK